MMLSIVTEIAKIFKGGQVTTIKEQSETIYRYIYGEKFYYISVTVEIICIFYVKELNK